MASRRELVDTLGALIRVIDYASTLEAVQLGAALRLARTTLESAVRGDIKPLPWTPLEPVGRAPVTAKAIKTIAETSGRTEAEVAAAFERIFRDSSGLWASTSYQVDVRELEDNGVHLSIKRVDQSPVHDWRDLQRIKNQLVGPECEMVELYPAESRKVDAANQYHLWGSRDPTFRFGFGFEESWVDDTGSGPHGQRPLEGDQS